MKKTVFLILTLCLMLCLMLCLPCAALAQAEDMCSGVPLVWYELSAEDTVLTVSLPLEDSESSAWRFLIGNENVIELLTCELTGDETGAAAWVGSFRSFGKGGSTVIQFTRTAQDGSVAETRLIDLTADENAVLTINDAVEDSFYYISADGTALIAALEANPTTGYSWLCSFSDPQILDCAAEEYLPSEGTENMTGAGGTWTAVFTASYKKAGHVTLTLNYARPWESVQPLKSHTIRLFVNESGLIEPVSIAFNAPQIAAGRYLRTADESSLTLRRNADGTYSAEIAIIRLTLQDDGIGSYENGALTIVATDASGNPMTWTITQQGDALSAVVTESSWSLLPEGEAFLFEQESTK